VEVTRPSASDTAATHDQLLESLSTLLESWSWRVEREPHIGTVRPDLVAEDPEGRPYLFEIKTGGYQGHLGALGQVETFRNALKAEIGREPTVLLLVADDTPEELSQVARDVGVTLLEGFQNDESALVDLLSDALPGAHEGPEPTVTK
jgi:hypothetical protein